MNHSTQPNDKFSRRRLIFAVAGTALIVIGMVLAYSFARQEFYDFYAIPRDEGDKILPRRWQDIVILCGIWTVLIAWLWVGCYLVRRAFRRKPRLP